MDVLAEFVTKTIGLGDEQLTLKKLSVQDEESIQQQKTDLEKGVESILRSVVSWSFKGAKGEPLMITKTVVVRLRSDLITRLAIEILEFNAPLDKKEETDG